MKIGTQSMARSCCRQLNGCAHEATHCMQLGIQRGGNTQVVEAPMGTVLHWMLFAFIASMLLPLALLSSSSTAAGFLITIPFFHQVHCRGKRGAGSVKCNGTPSTSAAAAKSEAVAVVAAVTQLADH